MARLRQPTQPQKGRLADAEATTMEPIRPSVIRTTFQIFARRPSREIAFLFLPSRDVFPGLLGGHFGSFWQFRPLIGRPLFFCFFQTPRLYALFSVAVF